MSAELLDLLEARTGIVCAVGAGGKKTTLERLFAAHTGRVALTATVMTTFAERVAAEVIIESEEQLLARVQAARRTNRVAYARPSAKPDRLAGVPPALIERIHADGGFNATYVKADGARMRWVKAPAEDEPVLPPACQTVIALVSARVFGAPLSERIAHRVDRLSAITGARIGDPLTPVHIGRLFASSEGLLQHTQHRRVVPVINMVDDDARRKLAEAAAREALAASSRFDRVVLACMRDASHPVVAVIQR